MMKTAKIKYNGMVRAASQQDIADGFCDEIINLRYRAGKLQGRGNSTRKYGLPVEWRLENPYVPTQIPWRKIWKHEQDNVNNYIGFTDFPTENKLSVLDFSLGTTVVVKEYESVIDVQFLKRFMIVIYEGGMDRYIWKDGEYKPLNITERPQLSIYTSAEELVKTGNVDANIANPGEIIRGKYYAKLNELSGDNYITGGMFIRAAFKMFDGSYILHTIPRFISVSDFGINLKYTRSVVAVYGELLFYVSKINVLLLKSFYDTLSDVSDLIVSVDIFATKFETIIKVDEDIDDRIKEIFDSDIAGDYWLNSEDFYVNSDFKDICDSASWYKVKEYSLSHILKADIDEELDLKDFYQDYATRETLPVDQFSHHELSGLVGYNYNSRLILGNISTKFGDYRYFPANPDANGDEMAFIIPSFITVGQINVRLLVTVSTDNGEIKKLGREYPRTIYALSGGASVNFIVLGIGELGYPDARATKIEVLAEFSGIWKITGSYALTKSKYGNFAYYINPNFNTNRKDHVNGTANYPLVIHPYVEGNATIVNLEAYPEQLTMDMNRVQISELNNPFYFPAENSYQVGVGEVLSVMSNSEPLSTGQFGEYPLSVFTSKGIWAMYQGQGDVLFSSVKPVNGEVINNADAVVSVGNGVTFTSDKGLFITSGNQTINISELMEGLPNLDLQGTDNFRLRIDHPALVQLLDAISIEDFLIYLADAKIGFDKNLNELLVSNSAHGYSYVYAIKESKWTKISGSYSLMINAYPDLQVVRYGTGSGVYDFGDENFDNPVQTLICTRPVKIDGEMDFILIHRALQRCEITTDSSMYAGFYVFGSNDLLTWQLLQGSDRKTGRVNDILTTRSHLKCKYFVFVFASTVKEYSSVNNIELQYYYKLNGKIR